MPLFRIDPLSRLLNTETRIRQNRRMTAHPSGAAKSGFFIPLLLFALYAGLANFCCKSNSTPDEPAPAPQYRAQIEVIYERDPAKIINAGADDIAGFGYLLFDPDKKLKVQTDKYLEGNYRIGSAYMEKIGENKFKGYLEQVLVQTESWHGKHAVWAQDPKLYDGAVLTSAYTPNGVTVQYAYATEISGYQLSFKTSK